MILFSICFIKNGFACLCMDVAERHRFNAFIPVISRLTFSYVKGCYVNRDGCMCEIIENPSCMPNKSTTLNTYLNVQFTYKSLLTA